MCPFRKIIVEESGVRNVLCVLLKTGVRSLDPDYSIGKHPLCPLKTGVRFLDPDYSTGKYLKWGQERPLCPLKNRGQVVDPDYSIGKRPLFPLKTVVRSLIPILHRAPTLWEEWGQVFRSRLFHRETSFVFSSKYII